MSDTDSAHSEAKCEGKKFREEINTQDQEAFNATFLKCLQEKPKVLKVSEGEIVNVGVEPDISDRWRILYGLPADSDESFQSGLLQGKSYRDSGLIEDKTYAKALTVPTGLFSETNEVPLGVISFDDKNKVKAIWAFTLKKK
ncbi:MAG: hypothetical protein HOV68_32860 [Streptomycetaceae bacterium]|nr:hypothetical protein [Streptomycetaceae bacterium]